MKCPTTILTPAQYLSWAPEKWRADLSQLHDSILAAAPSFAARICHGMLGYGPATQDPGADNDADWFVIGLAAQKHYLALYLCAGGEGRHLVEDHATELGTVNCGKSCARFKQLPDLNLPLALQLVAQAEAWKRNETS